MGCTDKISGSLWQYWNYEPNNNITGYESFKFKSKITNDTSNVGNVYVKIAVPLKCLRTFWEMLEIHLIKCVSKFFSTCLANCVISNEPGATTFAMTGTKLYAPVALLSV